VGRRNRSLALTDYFSLPILLRSVGGSDSTSGMTAWWMLAMLAYPETLARAQAELDVVVGRALLPTFAGYPLLPYTRAMVKDVLRWKPPPPLGWMHQSTDDDWCEGIFIPKGTICIANMWHMNRNQPRDLWRECCPF